MNSSENRRFSSCSLSYRKTKMDREVNWNRLLLAFLIACFLFTLGLFLGYLSKGLVEANTLSVLESTKNELVNLETLRLFEGDYPCSSFILDKTSEKLDYLGQIISTLEVKKGKNDVEVLELKKLYTLLEVRHMLLIKERQEKCGQNYSVFLFFYSNKKECPERTEQLSFILSYIRNKYDFARVYSFDVNLDSDMVSFMKSTYNVTACGTLVLNDKKVDEKIENSEDLEKLLSN